MEVQGFLADLNFRRYANSFWRGSKRRRNLFSLSKS